jgi:hypothetical protein
VDGDLCAEFLAEMSSVAAVIKIAVGQRNELEGPGPATRALQFFFDDTTLAGPASVDQDKPITGPDEVAVDGDIEDERRGNGLDLRQNCVLRWLVWSSGTTLVWLLHRCEQGCVGAS